MMTDVNYNEITTDKKLTVGERLSHAREEKKLTIGEIASELRLSKRTIELIENAQWTELNGRAYARGYFTNYVKLLGLPEDELLAAFNSEYAVAEPTISTTGHHQIEISNKKISWLPSLLFITVLVIVWFVYQQMQNTAEIVPEEAEESPLLPLTFDNSVNETVERMAANSQLNINELEQTVSPDADLLVPSGAGASVETTDVPSDNSELVASDELATIALQDVAQEVNVAASNNSGVVVDTVAVQDVAQESVTNELMLENTAVIPTNSLLDLRFSDDCWVEVKDADNKILLRKLMTKDDAIVLKGRAPLTVMLGRTSVAQVRFNDVLFDPSAFSQGGVARFTLGAES